ncbi:MAG: class I SAM-dependent methyltransferase [Chloroflexi bacterium]|nr:class I SAM-dependent methyltransferase [Chloroflexota bacterium]
MDLAAYYDAYWETVGDNFDEERLGLIVQRVNAGENVLEVDCGPGVLAAKLKARGATVVGTDLSPVAVKRAQKRGIPTQQVDLDKEKLPFGDGAFDTVVSNNAMEHRIFPERTLDECVRVLRPGGKFLLCLPNIGHWLCRWWLLRGRFPYVRHSPTDSTHLHFYAIPDAIQLCQERGIHIVEIDGSASLWAKTFYPAWVRKRRFRPFYTRLAHRWPALFSRDFVLLGYKQDAT